MKEQIKTHKSYEDFKQRSKDFRPKDGVDYEWCNKFSQWEYGRMAEIVSNLDRRAEDLIRLLAGGVGLLVLLVGYLLKAETGNQSLFIVVAVGVLPMLVMAMMAFNSALKLKRAVKLSVPPNTHEAATFAEHYSEAAFWFEVGVASQGMRIAADRKGEYLNKALMWLRAAIGWFVILVIVLCAAAFLGLTDQASAFSASVSWTP